MSITVYIKPNCSLCQGVEAVFKRLNVPYIALNVEGSAEVAASMQRQFGQVNAPCVVVNGLLFPETTGEAIERYLRTEGQLIGVESPLGTEALLHRRIARENTQKFF